MQNVKVFTGSGQTAHEMSEEMCEAIKDVVYSYAGRMPLTTAIGVIEIAKLEILREQED